jgi:NTP pyrophosphatase (non-canonical NTP hydrolase)
MNNYIEEVLKTNSPQWHGDSFDLTRFEDLLIDVIRACNRLDEAKKWLFAGKGERQHTTVTCRHLPVLFNDKQIGIDIIHCIIGMATEAGELCELLYGVAGGKEFDVVNFKEEIGDSLWYQALGLNACKSSFNEVMIKNIAKLRARYSKGFTSQECLNRNPDNERKVLEDEHR